MPAVPISNNGTTFYNPNNCFTFNQVVGASIVQLSSYPCAEITIVNKTGNNVLIFDNGNSAAGNGFLLSNNDQFTFRGLTNSSVVSASATSTGSIYCRTQYYSINAHTAI